MIEIHGMGCPTSWADAERDPRAGGETLIALQGLRAMLRQEWRGWESEHPLACQFFVPLQQGPCEGVRIWRMIQILRDAAGVGQVVGEGVGSSRWNDYVAAVMGLEFCSRVHEAGHEAAFVQRDDEPSPDARVKLQDRFITVEFKGLHDSDEAEVWIRWELTVMGGLAKRGIGGEPMERELTPAALAHPEAVVEGIASIVARGVKEWEPLPQETGRARLSSSNMGKTGYPFEQTAELTRLKSKLRSRWWKPLRRAGGPTLLVVRAQAIFGDGSPPRVSAEARRIREAAFGGRQSLAAVGALLVYEEPFWGAVPTLHGTVEDCRVRIDTSQAGFARHMALVPNPRASVPLTDAECDLLVGPTTVW